METMFQVNSTRLNQMNNILTYAFTHDPRLAPNPFWKYSSFSVYTPTHQDPVLYNEN